MLERARRIAPYLIFPAVLGSGLWLTAYFGVRADNPISVAIVVSLSAIVLVALLERLMPYRPDWNTADGDVATDVWHTVLIQVLLSRGLNVAYAAALAGVTAVLAQRFGSGLWPHAWPLVLQLGLMLLIAEFGRYWVHRLHHKVPLLWRLHAVHHSPSRLYVLNASRIHPLEKIVFMIPETVPFMLLGTNVECLAMYATFNSIHGLFQHGNVDVRLGPLNYIFSMAELHRWHHSRIIAESDNNFGNNLIVWDLVFGTFFLARDREVGPIGLLADDYPKGFAAQIAAPFASRDISKPVGYVDPSQPARPEDDIGGDASAESI